MQCVILFKIEYTKTILIQECVYDRTFGLVYMHLYLFLSPNPNPFVFFFAYFILLHGDTPHTAPTRKRPME